MERGENSASNHMQHAVVFVADDPVTKARKSHFFASLETFHSKQTMGGVRKSYFLSNTATFGNNHD